MWRERGTVWRGALRAWAVLMVTTHEPVPVQSPLQPAKVLPEDGVAVRVTLASLLKLPVQVEPQLMPAGLLVTLPEPLPDLVTVRA